MVLNTLNEREGSSHLNCIDSTFVVLSTKCHQIQGDWYQEPKMKKKMVLLTLIKQNQNHNIGLQDPK
jgi:hypothetical protein